MPPAWEPITVTHRIPRGSRLERVEAPGHTWEAQDRLVAALVAQGRIVRRLREADDGPYAVRLYLVEHPALPKGDVLAMFESACSAAIGVWRGSPTSAIAVLASGTAFNWT